MALPTSTPLRRLAGVTITAGALALAGFSPAAASPGDWTQLSQFPTGASYPGGRNIDQPTIARFGPAVQVVWHGTMSPSADSYFTAILDGAGNVTTPSREIVTGWADLIENPSLISVGAQRLLGFSGLTPGRTGAAYYATSPDGATWSVGTGALSATQSAYASYGFDVVDYGGTPVWVGNAGSTAGISWHVGISATDPAPAGSDGRLDITSCCSYGAAAARDQVTGAVYAAYYSNSSVDSEQGIQAGQILPTLGAFAQAPQSVVTSEGSIESLDPGQRVAMTARPGGGVFVAYRVGYPSTDYIRVLNLVNGATMTVPGSAGARNISMSAGADGRLWLAWIDGDSLMTAQSNATATVMGAAGSWSAPRRASTLWKTAVSAGSGTADVVLTASVGGQINTWNTVINRTLTIDPDPGTPRRGRMVTITVSDAGSPVAGARVTFAGRSATTNRSGTVTLRAPGSAGSARITARKAGFHAGATVVRVR